MSNEIKVPVPFIWSLFGPLFGSGLIILSERLASLGNLALSSLCLGLRWSEHFCVGRIRVLFDSIDRVSVSDVLVEDLAVAKDARIFLAF